MVKSNSSSNTDRNLPWVEKYRPVSLDDLVSQKEIINTLSKLIKENKLPHLLFYGPPGTGKTSTILAAARQIFSDKYMQSKVLELNASDERGINVVRQKIVEFASTRGIQITKAEEDVASIKLIILDEADAMTKDAQNALRRVIEKYTDSTRFCIICNYLSRIIPALQSRCTRFRFAPLNESQVMPRLEHIAEKEGISITESGKKALLKLSKGDMRRVINALQSTALSIYPADVTEEAVYKCVGQPQPDIVKKIFNILWNKPLKDAYTDISILRIKHGLALSDLLEPLLDQLTPFNLNSESVVIIYDYMSAIEAQLATGCSEKLQSLALISAFIKARKAIFNNDDLK